MATNRDFTLRRHNGTDYDALLPTTHIGQIFTDDTLATPLQSVLDAKIPLTQKGAANGVAPLNSSSKIDSNYLPDSVFSGMKYIGSAALNGGTTVYLQNIFTELTLGTKDQLVGAYKIVTVAGLLGGQTPPGSAGTIVHILGGQDDSGGEATYRTLEVGDWIVLRSVELSDTYYEAYYDIVNNAYGLANATNTGIVRLSNATTTVDMSGNDVITEAVLAGLIGAGAGKIAAGDHTHAYQPLDTDLTTLAGLSNADGNIIVGNGSAWTVESGATARASLGLTIGTHVQAYDATLAGIAALAPLAAGNMLYTTGTDTFGSIATQEYGRGMLNWANATIAQTGLNLVPGTHVQAYDVDLAAIADLAKTNGNFIVGNGTTWVAESGATARASLSVYSTAEINSFLNNRPEIFYDTTTGAGSGDLIIDLD